LPDIYVGYFFIYDHEKVGATVLLFTLVARLDKMAVANVAQRCKESAPFKRLIKNCANARHTRLWQVLSIALIIWRVLLDTMCTK